MLIMKNNITTLVFLILIFLSAFKFSPQTYITDTKKSKLSWVGYKVGSKQYGDLNLTNGSFVMNGTQITGGSFTFKYNFSS
jgi:hypothetical protein